MYRSHKSKEVNNFMMLPDPELTEIFCTQLHTERTVQLEGCRQPPCRCSLNRKSPSRCFYREGT